MNTELLRPCFTVGEAAQYLRISRALLYQLIRQGRIKTVKIGARTIVRSAELERFLTSSKQHRSVLRLQRCHRDVALVDPPGRGRLC